MRTGEIVEIPLRGLASTGNEYDCQDGELQVCHNAVNNGAGLRPIQEPTALVRLPGGWKGLVFVHHTSAGDVYIIRDNGTNAWYAKASDIEGKDSAADALTQITEPQAGLFADGEYQLTSVGNVLVANVTREADPEGLNGIHYYKYDAYKDTYSYIGQYPPDVALEFELMYDNSTGFPKGSVVHTKSAATVVVDDVAKVSHALPYAESAKLQDAVMGLVNEIANDAKKSSRFLNPFFVRYAYRLYDGTYIMQSAPVLMVPDYGYNPAVVIQLKSTEDPQMKIRAAYRPMALRARSNISASNGVLLKKWADIIQGVAVFITPPVLNYALTGESLSIARVGLSGGKVPDSLADSSLAGGTFSLARTLNSELGEGRDLSSTRHVFFYEDLSDAEKASLLLDETNLTTYETNFAKGFMRDGTIEDWINEAYVFYKLKEYTIDEAIALGSKAEAKGPAGFTTVKRDGSDGIVNLTTFEQLPDGYGQRSLKMPKYLHTYNARLNVANVDLREIATFPAGFLSAYTAFGSFMFPGEAGEQAISNGSMDGSATVYIEDNGAIRTAKAELPLADGSAYGEWGTLDSMPGYFFYPNPNAKWLHISATDRAVGYVRSVDRWIPLKKHPFLYGAYYFNGYYGFGKAEGEEPEIAKGEIAGVSHQTNYMYTSEVDNPFMFPSEGVNAIGSGEIVAIKSAAKAMSEGTAFGSMPLYAFCTDGVWPLGVGETGLFVTTNPPTRETLLNNDAGALLQVDSSVVFLSERGLMRLVGESTELLSGQLAERFGTLDVIDLPGWQRVMNAFDGGAKYLEADDFHIFIRQGARLAFDYVNYRMIVYRPYDAADPATHTAYVYDMTSEAWATMASRLLSSVDGYPGTMVNTVGGSETLIARFDQGNTALAGGGKAFYTTRPMKLGKPDTLKTVRTLVERAVSHGGAKYIALWGSRDMTRWVPIGAVVGGRMPRLGGTPYKYFIAAGWSQMDVHGDAISRLTIEEADKYTDKIR